MNIVRTRLSLTSFYKDVKDNRDKLPKQLHFNYVNTKIWYKIMNLKIWNQLKQYT